MLPVVVLSFLSFVVQCAPSFGDASPEDLAAILAEEGPQSSAALEQARKLFSKSERLKSSRSFSEASSLAAFENSQSEEMRESVQEMARTGESLKTPQTVAQAQEISLNAESLKKPLVSGAEEKKLFTPPSVGKVCRESSPCGRSPLFQDPDPAQPAFEKEEKSAKKESSLSVLVSLEMPETSLKELFVQLKKVGGRLVVRGLVEDSFSKTKTRLEQLGIEVDIDPEIFERFEVKAVPFFVFEKGKKTQTLRGNVTVAFALEKLKSQN